MFGATFSATLDRSYEERAGYAVGADVRASGIPFGLGSHVHWDRKLDGMLAQAIMSINAVKAVEIGEGVAGAGMRGSQVQDIILPASAWERGKWERRVQMMQTNSVDRDLLEEEARLALGRLNRNEVVIFPAPPAGR